MCFPPAALYPADPSQNQMVLITPFRLFAVVDYAGLLPGRFRGSFVTPV